MLGTFAGARPRTTDEATLNENADDGQCIVCTAPADGIDAAREGNPPVCSNCAKIRADGGVDELEEPTRWWGKPLDSRRYHIFEGEGRLAESLCGNWRLSYDGEDPEVDPDGDTFSEGEDCKACSRAAGVLDEEGSA